jgi:hypothetical protein
MYQVTRSVQMAVTRRVGHQQDGEASALENWDSEGGSKKNVLEPIIWNLQDVMCGVESKSSIWESHRGWGPWEGQGSSRAGT